MYSNFGYDSIRIMEDIATNTAQKNADSVDREARFPKETFDELKNAKLLSAPLSKEDGGIGAGLQELGLLCSSLAAKCGSSGLILAMHYVQVECIKRNTNGSSWFKEYLGELSSNQYLLSSIASEFGTNGNPRESICAPIYNGDTFELEKKATVASYAEAADAYLITCRRDQNAEKGDQLLVMFKRDQTILEKNGTWDTLGMRGTVGPSYTVTAKAHKNQIFAEDYAEISANTVVPFAHVLWAAVWEGIARDAVTKASKLTRKKLSKTQQPFNADVRLGYLVSEYKILKSLWMQYAKRIEDSESIPKRISDSGYFDWTIEYNTLKMTASSNALKIVCDALPILGVVGYKNDSEFSIAKNIRDLSSAPLMVPNESLARINANLSSTVAL